MTNRDPAFDALAQSVITSWGTPNVGFDQLATGIQTLYGSQLKFPAAWPQHRRDAFLNAHADAAATELATLLDDLTDTVVERYGREHHRLPDTQTLSELISAARSTALDGVELSATYDLLDEIVSAAADDPGRGEASMTCGARQRPSIIPVRPQHRRGRERL